MDKELEIKITANMQQFSQAMKGVTKRVQEVGKKMQSAGKKMTMAITAPLAIIGGKALQNYDRQIKAERRLASAIRSTGGNAEESLKDFKSWASQIQDMTLIGDEATLEMLTLATQMGVTGEGAKRAAKNAIGLADALDMNTNTAMRMAAAVEMGDTQLLQRYIPSLKLAETEAEKMAIAQKFMGDAFDTATKASKEGLGPLIDLKGRVDDLLESFGKIIAEAIMPFVDRVKDMVRMIDGLNAEQKLLIAQFVGIAAAVGPVLIGLSLLITALTAIFSPIGLIIVAIGALAAAFIHVRANWDAIVERFSNITFWKNAIIGMINFFLRNNPFAFIAEGYVELVALFGKKVENPFDLVAAGLVKLKGDTGEYENDFKSFGDAIKNTAKEVGSAFNEIGDDVKETTDDTKEAEDAANDAAAAYKNMAKAANAAAAAASNAGKTSGGGDPLTPDNDFADKQGVDDFNRSMAMSEGLILNANNAIKQGEDDTKGWSDGLRSLANVMQGGLVDAFQTMLSGGQNAFQAFGQLIKQLITRLIAAVIVAAALSLLLPGIFGADSASGAFENFGSIVGQVSGFGAFADGGIVSGPTLGLVGEYAGASSNPEVIAPLDKLQGMMAGAGGNVTVTGKISGQDILLSNERASNRRTRQRGF